MNRSTPGLPVHHQLPESTQTHVHRVDDAIQPSHKLKAYPHYLLASPWLLVGKHASFQMNLYQLTLFKTYFRTHDRAKLSGKEVIDLPSSKQYLLKKMTIFSNSSKAFLNSKPFFLSFLSVNCFPDSVRICARVNTHALVCVAQSLKKKRAGA